MIKRMVVVAVMAATLSCGEGASMDAGSGGGGATGGGSAQTGGGTAATGGGGAFDAGADDDAGSIDAGADHDAGSMDAGADGDGGSMDAGADGDAGSLDAGADDDAGSMDAGVDGDAGAPDAGSDAGPGCLEVDLPDGGCLALSLANVCSLRQLTVLHDGVPTDDLVGHQLADALASGCTPSVLSVDDDGGALAPGGAPLGGRDLALVCGGGSYFQPHVAWLEGTQRSPVYDSSDTLTASFSARDGGALFAVPYADFDGGFDYFLLELVRTQPDGPLSLVGYGVFDQGTQAAGWYFGNQLMPAVQSFTDAWYVVRWTDLDGDGQVGAADDFSIVGSGN